MAARRVFCAHACRPPFDGARVIPATGDIVRVRSRQYLVEGVEPPPRAGESTLVRLSCLEDDAQGDKLEVLWEREIDASVRRETDWNRIASRGFDEPRLFSAYLHTMRWNCVTATDAKLFQSPYRAGIEVMSPPGSHGPTSTGFTGSHVPTCRKGALLDAEPPRSDRA